MTNAFYNQFASQREFQRNNNHLLTVKMKYGKPEELRQLLPESDDPGIQL